MPERVRAPLIPHEHRRGLARRFLIVLGVALLIGGINWALRPAHGPVRQGPDKALVYALAISLLTWLFIDVARFVLRRPLRALPPGYWPPPRRAALLLAAGICTGYVLGTMLGDAYAGVSSWQLLQLEPNRFSGLLVSSLAISVAFIAYFHQRGRGEALQRQAREAQLQLLQSQLEPHMLFNTLANLRVLIASDPARAQAMLDRLIAFLRSTLAASRSPTHALAAEFERIDDYLALMQVRMGPRLATQLRLPDALRDVVVPPLLLQPLVENSIRHGLEPKVDGGRIEVSARRDGDALVLGVLDNGVGLGGAAPGGSTRFGLQQVRERLHTLYGARASLELQDAEHGGTLACIRLPLDV